MTRRRPLCAALITALLGATTVQAQDECLRLSPPLLWNQGDYGTIKATDLGKKRIEPDEVAFLEITPSTYGGQQIDLRDVVVRLAKPDFSKRLYLNQGDYTFALMKAKFAWPQQTTPTLVPGCRLEWVQVDPQGRLTPPRQAGISLVGSRVALELDTTKVKWGVAAEAGLTYRRGVDDRWIARAEARRTVTRGYFGLGARATGEWPMPHASITGALELPPFRRHPLWFVLEASSPRARLGPRRGGRYDDEGRPQLFAFSAGMRFDLKTVRR